MYMIYILIVSFITKRLISDLKEISDANVRWVDTQGNAIPTIPFDRLPFIIMGKKKWDCHHGKQRNRSNIQKNKQKRSSKVRKRYEYAGPISNLKHAP